MITFEEVSFAYETTRVINHVNLTVREGEFVTIIGQNGSGKSTLAKLMNGLLLPISGDARVEGVSTADKDHVWKIRQCVGIVFQNPDNQFVAPTVIDDVAFGLENLGVPRVEMMDRIEWALNQVNMWEHRSREPHRLSGGQKQRVAVAGILAMKPKVIVLDESTAMLDPIGREELMQTIVNLRKEGMTIVNITHYPEEAVYSDRLLVLDQGTIALEGPPQEVFRNVDQLRSLRLDAPFVVDLTNRLRKKGVPLAADIWNTDELVERLWSLF